MTEPKSRRKQLGVELEHARKLAGLGQRGLAAKIGSLNQTRVFRAENGKGALSRPDVEAWADATDADPPTRARLRALLDAAIREESSWGRRLGSKPHLQHEVRDRQAASHTVRDFQPTVVPGLLQTPEYARYVIPRADVDDVFDHSRAAAARMERQQSLFTGDVRFQFLIYEAVLHWPASRPELLAPQLHRIAALDPLKAVSIGVLPLGEHSDVLPWHNFVIFEGEDPCVEIELIHREELVTEPRQIELYQRLYTRLWDRAVVGPDAVALIQRAATALSS